MKFGGPKRPARLVTEAHQNFSFTRRTLALGAMQGGVGLMLAGRMAWLTVVEKDRYAALAESNRARSTMIPPRRGWMVDRHGQADRDQPLGLPRRSHPRPAAGQGRRDRAAPADPRPRSRRRPAAARKSDQGGRLPAGPGRRGSRLRALRGNQFAASRSSRRRARARLLPPLSGRRRGRASGRLCRIGLGRRL